MNVDLAIQKSLSYLATPEALASIERDPYWPKWDSPWWHMLLLFELGLAQKIPKTTVTTMVKVLKTHYLPTFPFRLEEVPAGKDPYRHIACHCAVGSIYQVLFACGVDVDRELSWMRPWILKYQLPDGGLNCDEAVYLKANQKSSIVSTLPCLESILFCHKQDLTSAEIDFLNKGANYLLRQKLFRKSTGEVIDKDWLEIRFPRFYEYDFLRGYYFLMKWKELSGFAIPEELAKEVHALVDQQMTNKGIVLKRYNLIDKRSRNPSADGSWMLGETSEFELLKAVSFADCLCLPLTQKWQDVKSKS